MTTIGITVNARAVKASVEPRTHLADFLRDHLNLTGTHLGCEHGVCGACTLLLDDMPARSCITFAAACDGARVTTIEGLDDDEIATELRAAFTREHALQCGYCTPGMLISARDLVLRLDTADERAIRVGLSGNLCRCTGYVGIVRAVRSVIDERRRRGIQPIRGAGREQLGPVGSAMALQRHRPRASWITVGRRRSSGAPRRHDNHFRLRARQGVRRAFHRRFSARQGLCDVRRYQAGRGLPSRRFADGQPDPGACRGPDPRQARPDFGGLSRSRPHRA